MLPRALLLLFTRPGMVSSPFLMILLMVQYQHLTSETNGIPRKLNSAHAPNSSILQKFHLDLMGLELGLQRCRTTVTKSQQSLDLQTTLWHSSWITSVPCYTDATKNCDQIPDVILYLLYDVCDIN